jgi:hypothetical protein
MWIWTCSTGVSGTGILLIKKVGCTSLESNRTYRRYFDMESRYKVWNLQDDTYQVVKLTPDPYEPYGGEHEEVMYQGSLSDCEAWLRLHEKGYI